MLGAAENQLERIVDGRVNTDSHGFPSVTLSNDCLGVNFILLDSCLSTRIRVFGLFEKT